MTIKLSTLAALFFVLGATETALSAADDKTVHFACAVQQVNPVDPLKNPNTFNFLDRRFVIKGGIVDLPSLATSDTSVELNPKDFEIADPEFALREQVVVVYRHKAGYIFRTNKITNAGYTLTLDKRSNDFWSASVFDNSRTKYPFDRMLIGPCKIFSNEADWLKFEALGQSKAKP